MDQILLSHDLFVAAFDEMQLGVILVNSIGTVTFINRSACSLLHVEKLASLDQHYVKVWKCLDFTGVERFEIDPVNYAMETKESVYRDDIYFATTSGTKVCVSVTVSPIVIQKEFCGLSVVFRDISKEKEIEEMKNNFISLASHQLRTPATGVKFYLSMMRDGYAGELSDKQKDFINQAFYSNERQLGVLNDLLDVAHIESGKYELKKVADDINALVVGSIADHASLIETSKHTVLFEKNKDTVVAMIDHDKIRMVVDNFLSNAIKYTALGGEIRLEVRHTIDTVYISVTDTGVGVSEEDLSKLFQKFSRVDNPLSTQVGGSGLGLYIAKKLVELHNGSIEVHSVLGKGTTFTVILPKGV